MCNTYLRPITCIAQCITHCVLVQNTSDIVHIRCVVHHIRDVPAVTELRRAVLSRSVVGQSASNGPSQPRPRRPVATDGVSGAAIPVPAARRRRRPGHSFSFAVSPLCQSRPGQLQSVPARPVDGRTDRWTARRPVDGNDKAAPWQHSSDYS